MERRPAEVGSAPGHTATLAAVGRAMHAASDKSRLLEDDLALKLAGGGRRPPPGAGGRGFSD